MEFEKIKEILIDLISADADKINEKTSFNKDLGMDSLDVFQMAAEIEDAFDIEIPEDAFRKIKTVGDAVEYIKKI